jgi:aerobic-type carbon monoxide dehydrogenase small subunit (CoxS/CutS family)
MPDQPFSFTVNGQPRTVATHPARTLLEVLREDLQLTGTKYGCGEGQCAACTVLVDGEPVYSCLTDISSVAGKKITTLEGLAKTAPDGKSQSLHPVQQAFIDEAAYQCGYCTSGMILATVSLLAETPQPTDAEILAKLNKHICRCGTYPRIIAAVKRAAGMGK